MMREVSRRVAHYMVISWKMHHTDPMRLPYRCPWVELKTDWQRNLR